jgi:hypothetical protein
VSDLERTLSRAERRLALRRGLVRGGWTATSGVLLLEVGLLAGDALGLTPGAAILPGALALAAAPLLVALAPRPGRRVTAAVLDARLDLGATLVTAAEALDGQHARFRAPVLAEAGRALTGRSLAAALPVQAPAGLLLGGAAAALLPAVLMGLGAGARPTTGGGDALPLLVGLDPRSSGSGAGDAPASADGAPAPADAPLAASPLTGPADGADPLGGLAPEVAAVLRERLAELMRALPPRPADAAASAPAGAPDQPDDDLARALRAGDAAAALRAFEDLSRAASAGDPAATRRLADLAAAERAGAGTGAAPDEPPTAPDGAGPAPSAATDRGLGGARERLPRELELASRRYFEASPGATRPTTRGGR